MIGSDGIVLAIDQRLTQPAEDEQEFDDHEGICKITTLEKYKVVYAGVGDYISAMVGDKIASQLNADNFDFANIAISLRNSAISTLEEAKLPPKRSGVPDEDRSLLVVFYGNQEPQLWRLRITPPQQSAERILGMTIKGAIGNRARFFDRYYRKQLPIDTLSFLAAHIVLTAGRIDPTMIDDLDVAQFDTTGFRLLTENEKVPLRERSEKLDALIREKLCTKSP
jgi:hypothetical protein